MKTAEDERKALGTTAKTPARNLPSHERRETTRAESG